MGNEFQVTSLWQRAVYLLFIMPADAFFTNIFFFSKRLSVVSIPPLDLVCGALAGTCIWGAVLTCLSKKARPFLWIPFVCLIMPCMYYVWRHHIGLAGLLIVWALWIGWEYNPNCPRYIKAFYLLLLFCPLVWTLVTVYQDAVYPQLSGKSFMQFLQEHQLQNKRIFASWKLIKPEDLPPSQQILYPNGLERSELQAFAIALNFYAPQNLFANFNETTPHRYGNCVVKTPQLNEQTLQTWRNGPLPDLFIGEEGVLKSLLKNRPEQISQYAIVFRLEGYNKWKSEKPQKFMIPVWARVELIEPHHLAAQDTFFFYLKSFKG